MRNFDTAQRHVIRVIPAGELLQNINKRIILLPLRRTGDIFKGLFGIQFTFNCRCIHRLDNGRLKLCCLQGIEHLQPFHDAVKLVGPTGLPVLHRLENMQHGRTPGGKFTRDPFPSSTPGARKIILTDMVRNGTAISINLHTGPQKTVPDTVSWRVHPFRTHGFKTRTKQLRALRIPDRLHKDFAVKRMNAHTFTDKFRKRAFPFHVDLTKHPFCVF
ncbi:hypothetical protein ExPUPEC61_00803 [Escherichia coli]|nr:hypothetical protein ExPUPEC61_00803 [Escherichia coli]